MKLFVQNVWKCLTKNAVPIGALAAVIGMMGYFLSPVKWFMASNQRDNPPIVLSEPKVDQIVTHSSVGNIAARDVHVTHNHSNPSDLDRYIQSIERQLSGLQDRLERANADKGALSSENRILLDRMNELKSKSANAAIELEQAQKRVADTEQRLAAYSNTIDPEQLEQARRMLRDFDFDGAEEIFRGIVEANELTIRQSASAEFGLGQIAEERLDWQAAYQHYKRAYDFDNDNPQYADVYATIAWRMGRYPEAVQIRETALQQVRDAGQQGTVDHAKALHNLALLYSDQGDYARAEPLYEEALSIYRRVLGNDHPDTASSLNNLANLYSDQGDYERAKPMFEEALSIRRRVLGNDHRDTAMSMNNLANSYSDQGDFARAEPMYDAALSIYRRVLGNDHPDTAGSLNNLALLYRNQGDYARAEPLYDEALSIRRRVLGNDHPDTASSLYNLALLYHNQGDYARAEPMYEEALSIRRCVLGNDHPDTANSLNHLAILYAEQGDLARAKPLLRDAVEILERTLGAAHPNAKGVRENYERVLAKMKE